MFSIFTLQNQCLAKYFILHCSSSQTRVPVNCLGKELDFNQKRKHIFRKNKITVCISGSAVHYLLKGRETLLYQDRDYPNSVGLIVGFGKYSM